MRFLNNLKTTLLLAALMALCMGLGQAFGGSTGMMIGFAFGLVSNVLAYFFSDRIALMSVGAREVTRDQVPWFYDMIARLAERAGLPMPKVCVSPQAAPNAFATGRNPKNAAVCITDGMLRNFPPHEIEGVMAHELAHVKHRDILISTIAATIAGVISQAAYFMMWFGGGGSSDRRDNPFGPIGMLLMIILAPIAAMLIQLAISRQREYAADSYGGELCGDPMKLASALARLDSVSRRVPFDANPAYHSLFIVKPLSGAGGLMTSLFSTHPPIAKRISLLERQAANFR